MTSNKSNNGTANAASPGSMDSDLEVRCGYGKCRPALLQTCNNSKMMLVIMSMFVFTQGFVVNGVFNVIVSTLERRFLLRSTQMGWVASAYDFSAAFFGVIISYLGSGRYKARWLSMAAVFMFMGSIVLMLPHFTTDLYEWGQYEDSTCNILDANSTSSAASCVASGLQSYVGVFALSNIIFGVGGATIYTVGTAYIDDSVPSVSSPLYLGIFFGFAAMGPGVGYLIGGSFLKIYVDTDKVDRSSIPITEEDPRWVGAWWIGAFLSAVVSLLSVVALSCFGAELPSTREVRATRESQLHKGAAGKQEVIEPNRPDIRNLPNVFVQLFKNPPFVFTTLAGITESMMMSGLSAFGAKYIQNMYRVSAASSGFYTGGVIVVGLAGGIAFGGFICRCFRLKVKGMLKFSFGVCFISTLCTAMFWMSCGQTTIAGVHSSYLPGEPMKLESTCNKDCQCTTESFEAACDTSGIQYFSPCHAGCHTVNGTEYSNCSCVPVPVNSTVSMVTMGSCKSSCPMLLVFLVILFIYAFTTIAADVPAEQAVLRSIPENHKTIMCGTNRLFVRLLGTIPGAVIVGAATDSGCLIWQTECGKEVSCWVYDNNIVSRNYFIIGLVTKVFSLLFFFLAHWFYEPPNDVEINIASPDGEKEKFDLQEKSLENESFEADLDTKGTKL